MWSDEYCPTPLCAMNGRNCAAGKYSTTIGATSAQQCALCNTSFCPVGSYRGLCLAGATHDAVCAPCTIYRKETDECPRLTCTRFSGHGRYNDSCPEECVPPFREDCSTGQCKRCDTGQVSVVSENADGSLAAECRACPVGGTCDGSEIVECDRNRYFVAGGETSEGTCARCPPGMPRLSSSCNFGFPELRIKDSRSLD